MELKIYLDRIKDGHTEVFEGTVPSLPLLPEEPDLRFDDLIQVSGKAYLAGDHVILELQAKVLAWLPCAICNKPTQVSLELPHFHHTESLENISSGVLDFSPLLREDLLLELPQFVECQKESCPERDTLRKYSKTCKKTSLEDSNFPFAGL